MGLEYRMELSKFSSECLGDVIFHFVPSYLVYAIYNRSILDLLYIAYTKFCFFQLHCKTNLYNIFMFFYFVEVLHDCLCPLRRAILVGRLCHYFDISRLLTSPTQ